MSSGKFLRGKDKGEEGEGGEGGGEYVGVWNKQVIRDVGEDCRNRAPNKQLFD